MNTIETGGSAFPLSTVDPYERSVTTCDGMTLRDYFAAKAMQSYIAHNKSYDYSDIAEVSFCIADQMLKARSQS